MSVGQNTLSLSFLSVLLLSDGVLPGRAHAGKELVMWKDVRVRSRWKQYGWEGHSEAVKTKKERNDEIEE